MNISGIQNFRFASNTISNKKEEEEQLKQEPAFRGKEQIISGAAAAAISAAALFQLSKANGVKPSDSVNAYYQNELHSMPKELKLEQTLKRFSPEEQYEIEQNLSEIEMFPNIFKMIAGLKINESEYRFSADDTMALFLESASNIEKNPRIFKQIVDIKDKEGNPRFNANDCVILMNNAKYIFAKNAEFLTFANAVNEDGSLMYDADECVSMLRNLPQKDVINLDVVKNKKAEPEKLKSLMARIRECDDKNMIILDTGEVLPKETAEKVKNNFIIHNHACRELIKLKNSDGGPRFTEKETCDLLAIMDKLVNKNAGRLYSYLTYKNDDNTTVFTNEQCIKMLKDSDRRACLLSHTIFVTKNTDYSLRFTPEEYVEFLTDKSLSAIIAKYPSEFIAAASVLNEENESKYSAEECLSISQDIESYPDVFEQLIKTKNNIYSLKIKPQDITELGEDFKFIYDNRYNRDVYPKVFELKERFGIDKEVIKSLKPFIAANKKHIDVVSPQAFARFLEANYSNGQFDIENMQENIKHLRKFKISNEKFEALMQLKEKHGLSPKVITELIIAG